MNDNGIDTSIYENPDLDNPTMICGLPGIGSIGKIAADYLAIELKAELFGALHSTRFPSQVLVNNREAELMKNEFYYTKDPDLIILCGNSQPLDSVGMYELGDKILKIAKKFSVTRIITLAAYASGYQFRKPRVFRAGTSSEVIEDLTRLGVIKMHGGAISGINGLLIGLCTFYDMQGICLLGETSGRDVSDLKAARALLKVLSKMLNIEVSLDGIEKADEIKQGLIREVEHQEYRDVRKEDDDHMRPYG
ncbi:MAG: PAC2 family protein [Halobacteriota archaeon]|nr:PAC2 family protein [Halobacteriota archaeon]